MSGRDSGMPHASPPTPLGGIGLIDRSDRVRIEVTGPDRAKFLHNVTTNEVKRLAPGRGCEAFVTSLQGKTLAYVILLVTEDRILVRSDPGGMELAWPHLRKYGVFDDVAIEERTAETFELHLAGAGSAELVRRAGASVPEDVDYAHLAAEWGGQAVWIIRESPCGLPGFTLIGDRRVAQAVGAILRDLGQPLGLIELDRPTFEALRIEAGTPVFGQDITEKNLPQEIGRDARAISFVKGCYLGQETVARIDALGHVNQVLKGLQLEPHTGCPAVGSILEADGKRVGVVTSAAVVPWRDRPLALALIRTSHARAGAAVRIAAAAGDGDGAEPASATVSELPFPQPA
jgi:folate-binding protein YgfZ